MRTIIITNLDSNSGSGHFKRCTVLANQLGAYGVEVFFLMSVDSRLLIKESKISNISHNYLYFDNLFDLNKNIELINPNLLIVDGYNYDINFEKNIKKISKDSCLCVIDDLNRPHFCDYLINSSFILGASTLNTMPTGKSLFGPIYSIIDAEYSKRFYSTHKNISRVSRVLVYFGGVDSKSQTLAVAEMLVANRVRYQDLVFDIVIGAINKDAPSIKKILSNHSNVFIYENLNSLFGLMSNADLMLGASGGTLWERACLGLPSISLCVAINQEPNHDYFTKNKLLLSIDKNNCDANSWNSALTEFISKPANEIQQMSSQLRKLVDGSGANRIVKLLLDDLC
jgi:UDP-2,4-diacetamido-2,4,6-trideoxy-beta-L-altropyranose hydrolase